MRTFFRCIGIEDGENFWLKWIFRHVAKRWMSSSVDNRPIPYILAVNWTCQECFGLKSKMIILRKKKIYYTINTLLRFIWNAITEEKEAKCTRKAKTKNNVTTILLSLNNNNFCHLLRFVQFGIGVQWKCLSTGCRALIKWKYGIKVNNNINIELLLHSDGLIFYKTYVLWESLFLHISCTEMNRAINQ